MRDLILRSVTIVIAKLGRCARCMQQSLLAALVAWALYGVGQMAGLDDPARSLIGLSALALTALWLVHVAAYTARTSARARREGERQPTPALNDSAIAPARRDVEYLGRRRALGIVLRAAGIGAMASVPAFWPTDGFAFCGQCTKNADCGVGFVCRNTAPVNSGNVCNECKRA